MNSQTHLTIIAALDAKRAIGRGNALPWSLPEDMKRFKALTTGKPIIMGRKTAESLGKALPFRRNVVLSRHGTVPYAGMHGASSIEEALNVAGEVEEVMIIGGAEIYKWFLPRAHRLRLTWVDTVVEDADAFFPAFSEDDWIEVGRDCHPANSKHAFDYTFVDYSRKGT